MLATHVSTGIEPVLLLLVSGAIVATSHNLESLVFCPQHNACGQEAGIWQQELLLANCCE